MAIKKHKQRRNKIKRENAGGERNNKATTTKIKKIGGGTALGIPMEDLVGFSSFSVVFLVCERERVCLSVWLALPSGKRPEHPFPTNPQTAVIIIIIRQQTSKLNNNKRTKTITLTIPFISLTVWLVLIQKQTSVLTQLNWAVGRSVGYKSSGGVRMRKGRRIRVGKPYFRSMRKLSAVLYNRPWTEFRPLSLYSLPVSSFIKTSPLAKFVSSFSFVLFL